MQKYYVLMGYALTAKPSTLHSEFYVAGDADARIVELEQQLAGANATIALFMGPDGDEHIEHFAGVLKSLMGSSS